MPERDKVFPDERIADGNLSVARELAAAGGLKPPQASLRRAVSTSYYAVFHALAKVCADRLVGATRSRRPNKAWVEVYRGLVHGNCVTACEAARNIAFPQDLKDFADAFVQLQRARESCDYDPMVRLNRNETLTYIALAGEAIDRLRSAAATDQVAFATFLLITTKGAKNARTKVNSGREGSI